MWPVQPPIEAMNVHPDELEPPFRNPGAGGTPGSGGVQLAPQRQRLSARVPRRGAARPRHPAAVGGLLRRRIAARRGGARPSADAGAFPALLRRRQPGTLRARPAHVRRAVAVLRQHPLDAGGRRSRHRRPRGRRRPGNLRPAHSRRRRAAADRGALQALSSGAAPADDQDSPRFRRRGAGRLPLDALDRRPQGRAAARRYRDRRPLRHQLFRPAGRGDRDTSCANAAMW